MSEDEKENPSLARINCLDVRNVKFHYPSDTAKSRRKTLVTEFLNSKDNEDFDEASIKRESEMRRLMMLLRNVDDVHEMLDAYGDVITKVIDADGNTLLSRAAKEGHDELVNLLLKHGADVNLQNVDLNTPLLFAVDHLHEAIVDSVLQAGADVNCANRNFETPLKLASSRGNLEITNSLLKAGACPNHMSNPGDTALNRACYGGNVSIIQALLSAGADVNSCNNIYTNGLSPLMLAVKRQQIPIIRLFLQAGADINSPNNFSETDDTPLIHVTKLSPVEIVHLFALAGADVSARNALGQSALTIAIRYTKIDAVKCLLTHGADVNQRTNSGDTPLILAAENGSARLCKEIINHGAQLDAVNGHGDTALIQAARNGYDEVMKVLIDAGVNLNHVNNSMSSALRFAIGHSLFNCSPCLVYLLEAGVEIHSELHYSVTLGLTHVVKELISYSALPQEIETCWLSFLPSLPKLSYVSPLCVALITERVEIIKYFLNIAFLTEFDLKILNGNHLFRQYLNENSRKESVHFLDFEHSIPMSLCSLSFIAVSKALGFNSRSRQIRVKATGLPPLIQRQLMFLP